jgi:dipeptidyl aminopeptidase/acylaminoacyl peptidase
VFTKNAIDGIALYDLTTKSFVELPVELVEMQKNCIRRVSDIEFALIAVAVDSPKSLYLVDVTKPSEKKLLKTSADIDVPASIFSKAETITFPRTHGQELGTSSYAMYCPPYNPDFEAPAESKPPLIIWIHGGPTSHAGAGLDMQGLQATQYFTSRGYAFVSTNYAGSTGYGRAYRDSLNFSWGIKDVEDSISCIDYLASKGLVDGDKVGIAGRSSGGYTVLQAMCTYPKIFAAGCSLFGIGNLKTICEDTHKFESHYGFALLFPPDATEEEQKKVFYDRSPCFHCDKIERPLVLLQGDQDKVVPIGQAEEMEKVLKAKGADVKLVVFKGEGHGWAMKESVKRTIEEMEALWKRTLL